MLKVTFNILYTVWMLLLTGATYFISLPLHIPVLLVLVVCAGISFALYKQTSSNISFTEDNSKDWKQIIVLLVGILFIVRTSLASDYVHGVKDSIGMWNYYARFLALPEWRGLFAVTGYYHPNHPLGLSASIAFFWKLIGVQNEFLPQILSFLTVLIIPVIIYLETFRKNFPIAVLTLIFFATDHNFLGKSIAQLADMPMALLVLSAFISMRHYKLSGNNSFLTLCAAALGGCLWMKNEGLVYVILFMLFYLSIFLDKVNFKKISLGFLPFLIAWLVYKCAFSTPNDVIERMNYHQIISNFHNKSYYSQIFQSFRQVMQYSFYIVECVLALYLLLFLLRGKVPEKNIALLLTCTLAVLCFYFFTTGSLEWQLDTSLERVLSQLMPAIAYCLTIYFSEPRSALDKNKPENF